MTSLDKIQFDNLLTQLAEQGASDLHLSVGSPPMLKVSNQLAPIGDEILTATKIEELILPLITDDQKKILTKEKSLVFSHTFENGLRFKINLFYQKGSLAVGLRFIPQQIKSVRELGLPQQIEQIIGLKSGLVFVAGPINSGKSTTLSAIVDHFNTTQQLRIVTLEKPIEFIFTNKKSIIQQREIGKDTPSFKEGLEDCVESSVDVIVVSNIETREEIREILELAQQGRLVIISTSANSVLEVILKLLSYFDEDEHSHLRGILSRVLQVVICQKLVVNKNGALTIVPEILFHSEAVRLSIQENKLNQISNILRTSGQQGMISFEQSLAWMVKQGEITSEEALKNVEDVETFKQMIGS